MSFPIPIPHFPIWVFFFIFSLLFPLSLSDPRISQASFFCGSSGVPLNTIASQFTQTMQGISQLVTNQSWGTQPSNSSPPVFALAQCHGDLSSDDCLSCFAQCRTKLPSCLPSTSGRIYLDGCFLRYDNYSFFNESIDPNHDTANCSKAIAVVSDDNMKLEFTKKVNQVILNATQTAVKKEGFGVAELKGGVNPVYALVQCWKSVSNNGCRECLEKGGDELKRCGSSKEGRAMNAGCYLRYSTEKFYSEGTEENGSSKRGVVVAIALSAVAIFVLTLFGTFIVYRRLSRRRKERSSLGRLASTVNKSSLNFRYETLEKATEFFSPSRKLGEGAAGTVFKGTLPDGRTVAVKRLFFNTRQWVDEFFNEVNLISGIQHNNLVKLLGCSIEGPESLLVYEYVPNKSLDRFLFDKNKAQILSWQQRFNIIVGIAKGLAYLHGGSHTRIIHRDIKSSNILLDEKLTAKIADFGLARCFAADESHLSTGIAGTLGYMAPEYLVRGQLTEKADVYSFGVLVLEIVCGKKNSLIMQESGPILQTVWKNFKSKTLPESVDPSLGDNFPVKEASDVLQIGLLCTQASVALRPSMSEVVQMLNEDDYMIPLPMQPPFLNASVINPGTSTMSFSLPTSSNGPTTIEASKPR